MNLSPVGQAFLPAGSGGFPAPRTNTGLENPVNRQPGKAALRGSWPPCAVGQPWRRPRNRPRVATRNQDHSDSPALDARAASERTRTTSAVARRCAGAWLTGTWLQCGAGGEPKCPSGRRDGRREPSRFRLECGGAVWERSRLRRTCPGAFAERPKTPRGTVEPFWGVKNPLSVPRGDFGESKNLPGYRGDFWEAPKSSRGTRETFWRVQKPRWVLRSDFGEPKFLYRYPAGILESPKQARGSPKPSKKDQNERFCAPARFGRPSGWTTPPPPGRRRAPNR